MKRDSRGKVPPGDTAIRTREGAFLLIKCNEFVARELYFGTEECDYYVKNKHTYRVLVGFGTFLLMISVVLLGNCNFAMQAAIGSSYIVLNGLFWASSLCGKQRFWDLSDYIWKDITPLDAQNADLEHGPGPEDKPNFTRTMWYAIRETRKIGWVKRCGAAPSTPQWDKWLAEAEVNAKSGNRAWPAIHKREIIVGEVELKPQDLAMTKDTAEQHAPAVEVPPQPRI
jgi:hypothetical protein